MPSRRSYLTALSLGAVAGCLADGPSGTVTSTDDGRPATTADESETDRPGSPTDETPPEALTVDGIVARKAITYQSTMGSGGVLAGEGDQYVAARVRGGDPEPAGFEFVADGRTWEPGLPETRGGGTYGVAGREGGLVGERPRSNGSAVLAFRLPSPVSADGAAIRYAGGETRSWPLSEEARETLAASAPRFELRSLSVPESVSQGDPLSVSLTVVETAGVGGRFLAAVYWPTKLIADDDESRVVERRVDAGGRATASLSIDTRYTTGEEESIDLVVDGHASARRSVRVEDASTPT